MHGWINVNSISGHFEIIFLSIRPGWLEFDALLFQHLHTGSYDLSSVAIFELGQLADQFVGTRFRVRFQDE